MIAAQAWTDGSLADRFLWQPADEWEEKEQAGEAPGGDRGGGPCPGMGSLESRSQHAADPPGAAEVFAH